ncbi:MAG: GNAT family N-acetyltransferase [Planctomycetota bacterium]
MTLPDFEAEAGAFDQAVLSTPWVDRFCSASDWIFSAREAWTPNAETWIRKGDHGWAVFLRLADALGARLLHSFDTMWGFSSPLAGADEAQCAAEFADAARAEEEWDFAVISGIQPDGVLYRSLAAQFHGPGFVTYECGRTRRWQASLEAGLDGYLGRRSAKFRTTVRAARRKAEATGIEFGPSFAPEPEAVDRCFARMLDIERRSWKGHEETGLLMRDMERFYRGLGTRLARHGGLRVTFARRDERDIGYVLGGTIGTTYRGFQFSFDRGYASQSLGNVMQLVQIEELCEEGFALYDLGIDMHYKRRWAETPSDTVSLAIMRE